MKWFDCFIAENEDKELLGHLIYYYSFEFNGLYVIIEDFSVVSEVRGKGIGSKLLSATMKVNI